MTGSSPVAGAPLSVLYVCDDYPPGPNGGIGSTVQVLGAALAAQGHQVQVLGVYDASWPAPDRHDDGDVRVARIRQPAGRLGWLRARARLRAEVASLARDGDIDVIEVPDYRGWAAGWPRLPVPVVVRSNGSATFFRSEMGEPPLRLVRGLERRSLARADHLVAATRYLAGRTAEVLGTGDRPWTVIPNVVEAHEDAVALGAREPRSVLFAGTLTVKKGVVSLLEAWPDVAAAVPGATLELWGKDGAAPGGHGSMRAHLEAMAAAAGVGGSVTFAGHAPRAALFDRLRQVRVAVYPSYAEAFGVAPMEAMSFGCPTVYTARPPGPELVDDEEEALLVDPGRPDSIAAALRRLLLDDGLAARLGERGRERVRRDYTVDRVLERTVAHYRDCIAAHAS